MSERKTGSWTIDPPMERLREQNKKDGRLMAELVRLPWVSIPRADDPHRERLPMVEVDASEPLSPLLGEPALEGSLRTVDVLNGCGNQCDTCLADSPRPNRRFSAVSWKRLLGNENFIRMLQPSYPLRFGSSGDILDHPEGGQILRDTLIETKGLDDAVIENSYNNRYFIWVWTNYRPRREEALDNLLRMATKNGRLKVVISLPLNRRDEVNNRWRDYALKRKDFFPEAEFNKEGRLCFAAGKSIANVNINDIRHPAMTTRLCRVGRVLSQTHLDQKTDAFFSLREGDELLYFLHAGYVKTYLNPDGLWLMMYVTGFESHTARAFTLITPENVSILSQLPYHPDFPTPPNWPGGTGVGLEELNKAEIGRVRRRDVAKAKRKLRLKEPTVVD